MWIVTMKTDLNRTIKQMVFAQYEQRAKDKAVKIAIQNGYRNPIVTSAEVVE